MGKQYYEALLKEIILIENPHLLEVIPTIISDDENRVLTRKLDEAEILNMIREMTQLSTPSLYGFGANFYLFYQDIIKKDLCAAINKFFTIGVLPRSWKAIFLTLILKKDTPQHFSEFRSIKLCNVRYKIISKFMNNRIKEILSNIISKEQGALVKGKIIQENIALVQEMTQSINHKIYGENMTVKLDMKKAYHQMNQDFLFRVLEWFGFYTQWIKFIGALINHNPILVLIDRVLSNFFTSGQRLRQGDPPSPTLFIIAEEVLSKGITHLLRNNIPLFTI